MRVVFFGTSKYCLPVLNSLKENFELKQVVVMPDRPVGRKKILTPCATKVWAQQQKIRTLTDMTDISDVDLGIVADFGKIIPEEIFSKPPLGTFNIHFSRLPDLRGASPVQQTILRGDKTAWITIIKIDAGLDTGPILWQKEYPIEPSDTTETLYTRLFQKVAKELPNINFEGKLTPQTGKPTFCKMLTKQDGFVPWEKLEMYITRHDREFLYTSPVSQIYNLWRAMTPWPGLWTLRQTQGKPIRMKILKCHLADKKLVLDEIQFEGKTPQKA